MAVIVGKIVSATAKPEQKQEENTASCKAEHEIEYFTAPVPVRRHKFGFGAVVVIQLLLTAALGVFLWLTGERGGEAGALVEELIRRFLNG